MFRLGSVPLALVLLTCSNVFMTIAGYAPFAVFDMKESMKLDFLWAALCLLGAVYFVFRS